ncbi:MAG: hypothetical protein M1834_009415 [Cirrosporium novae-zelandiae]|nr:MAG: hypothetical protein M1834_009415 [Cirrosporium novae-zelandiae]
MPEERRISKKIPETLSNVSNKSEPLITIRFKRPRTHTFSCFMRQTASRITSTNAAKMPRMADRIKTEIESLENQLWACLTSARPGTALEPYVMDETVMLLPGDWVVTPDTDPALQDVLDNGKVFPKWDSYDMQDIHVVVMDLMAATICYRIDLQKQWGNDVKSFSALCSTAWRQESSGDWKICSHHQGAA